MTATSEGIKSAAEQKHLMEALMRHMWDVLGLGADADDSDDVAGK
jgi:hypothetical protein